MQYDPIKWPHIHSSAQWETTAPARRVAALTRDGAVRFECPSSGSVVLLTDPAVIAPLTEPLARMRCPSCNEQHLLELS